jgi:diaminopropionate ammonia-lyase
MHNHSAVERPRSRHPMKLYLNRSRRCGEPLSADDARLFGPTVIGEVYEHLAPLGFQSTPLHRMASLGQGLGIGTVLIKDEGQRSSLGSFKALGGGHAVIRLALAEAGRLLRRTVLITELRAPPLLTFFSTLTLACATDGNHGRAVAAAAQFVGCKAVIYLHEGVSEGRAAALRDLGAQVVRIRGSYDDAVAEVERVASASGWHVVSDMSWEGYERVPSWVMQGYLAVADEVLQQCRSYRSMPTHVFLQAGVGGFAAAMAAYLTLSIEEHPPRFVVVEPDLAACLFRSAVADQPVRIKTGEHTIMAMLECYEPSRIAWRILERLAYGFVTINDAAALRTMRRLASPEAPDPSIVSGESGGAGLAGLIEAASDPGHRQLLGLDGRSVVLTINTEGATDPALYQQLLAHDD